MNDKEFSVANWAFDHGRPAGRFTDTLPTATIHFVPLRTPNRVAGVVGLHLPAQRHRTFEQEIQLETFVNQIALVVACGDASVKRGVKAGDLVRELGKQLGGGGGGKPTLAQGQGKDVAALEPALRALVDGLRPKLAG